MLFGRLFGDCICRLSRLWGWLFRSRLLGRLRFFGCVSRLLRLFRLLGFVNVHGVFHKVKNAIRVIGDKLYVKSLFGYLVPCIVGVKILRESFYYLAHFT